MKLKTVLLIALPVLIGGLVLYKIFDDKPGAEMRRQNTPTVKIEKPVRQDITERIELTGDVVAIQQASIFSKVSGTLERVFVNIGSPVQRGQLLALIDTTELKQQLQQAEATFFNARLSYDRTQQLLQQNLVSKQDLDNADAQLKISQANYDAAATRLSYARISAPFSGTITSRFMDPGAVVTTPTNATLFTLMDFDTVKIVVNILDKDIPLVKIGTRAVVTVDAFPAKEHLGTVVRLAEAEDPATRTMAAEIDIPNKDLLLKPGMFADVNLLVAQHNDQVTVPTQALLRDDSGYYVFIVQNQLARRVNVKIGVEQNGMTEILEGLTGSEDIIVLGEDLVKDGGQVIVQG
jgi:RND family efflux transporter MFP subunit